MFHTMDSRPTCQSAQLQSLVESSRQFSQRNTVQTRQERSLCLLQGYAKRIVDDLRDEACRLVVAEPRRYQRGRPHCQMYIVQRYAF